MYSRDQDQEDAERRKNLMDQLSGKDLFLLWWLFFDLEHTRNLRVLISHPSYRKFNHELVGFLANNLVRSVTKCTLQYNWILKADYITAFRVNMPNLKHVIFYHDLPTDDLLKLVAENCLNLWKLEFVGKSSNEFQSMNVAKKGGVFGGFGTKGKLTLKGYQILFERQMNLREIDMCQIEKELGKSLPLELAGSNSLTKEALLNFTTVFEPLKGMKTLRKIKVSHKYIEILEHLPQIEYLELNISSGTHYLETVKFLHSKPFRSNPIVSTEETSMGETTRLIPLENLVFSDMKKLETLSIKTKFPGIKALTLELRVFVAAKDYPEVQTEEENPDMHSLGVLNTDYSSNSVKALLQDLPISLHVRFALHPLMLKNENHSFWPYVPIFKSFDVLMMETLAAFNNAETIVMTGGATETLFHFRVCWISLRASNDHRFREEVEDDWVGWFFGLKEYEKKNSAMIEGYWFTKAVFSHLTVLDLNFGEPRPSWIQGRVGSRNPPISHDLFCQVFFLSDQLQKIKLTIPGGIAMFKEKEFLGRCKTTYGRKRLSKLSQISLWFSNVSVQYDSPERMEPETTILSVIGFLTLLSICSKAKSVEDMTWWNLTGDSEKRFLREHETEGVYLPCVTHLLDQYVPMVAAFKNDDGMLGPRWLCTDLKRAVLLTS